MFRCHLEIGYLEIKPVNTGWIPCNRLSYFFVDKKKKAEEKYQRSCGVHTVRWAGRGCFTNPPLKLNRIQFIKFSKVFIYIHTEKWLVVVFDTKKPLIDSVMMEIVTLNTICLSLPFFSPIDTYRFACITMSV